MRYGYDVKKCPICGTRLVNRVCPNCGSIQGIAETNVSSKYGKHEPVLRRINILLFLICAASLIGCVATRILNDRLPHPYETVRVTVTRSESRLDLLSTNKRKTVVFVEYAEKEYELRNVREGNWAYPVGTSFDACLADGVIYADETGVTSSSPMAVWYFVCLFGFLGFLTAGFILNGIRRQIRMQEI